MYYIDNTLLKDASLYMPKKKPTFVPVKINWNHPLSLGLKSVLISGVPNTSRSIIDLVSPNIKLTSSSLYPDFTKHGDDNELVHRFSGTTDYFTTPAIYNTNSKISVLTKFFVQYTVEDSERVFEIGGYNTNDGGISVEISTDYNIYVNIWPNSNSNTLIASWGYNYDIWHNLLVTSDTSGPNHIVYDNGVQKDIDSSATRHTNATELTIAAANNDKLYTSALRHSYTYIWEGRIININEYNDLIKDPYQILEPA